MRITIRSENAPRKYHCALGGQPVARFSSHVINRCTRLFTDVVAWCTSDVVSAAAGSTGARRGNLMSADAHSTASLGVRTDISSARISFASAHADFSVGPPRKAQ